MNFWKFLFFTNFKMHLIFSSKRTENIMDYDLTNQKVFFKKKWQSKIMRE